MNNRSTNIAVNDRDGSVGTFGSRATNGPSSGDEFSDPNPGRFGFRADKKENVGRGSETFARDRRATITVTSNEYDE